VDVNQNGIQDGDENDGVATVGVQLYAGTGTLVATTTTDSAGSYRFESLLPGEYYIEFDLDSLPSEYRVTRANVTSDQRDSDASPASGQTGNSGFLSGGMVRIDFDMGLYLPSEDSVGVRVGGQIWEDRDLDGEREGAERALSGQIIALYRVEQPDVQPLTAVSDADGNYLFENLPAGSYFAKLLPTSLPEGALTPRYYGQGLLAPEQANSGPLAPGEQAVDLNIAIHFAGQLSGLAWVDANGDGLNNYQERPQSNIEIRLYDGAGAIVGERRTDTEGQYHFSNLEPGTYVVEAVSPATYRLSPLSDRVDPTLDSDIDPATGLSASLWVGSSQHLAHVNVGLYRGAAFNHSIWLDRDSDGTQDEDEPGIAGLTVHLYRAADDLRLDTTTTDSQGRYGFATLAAGEYYVRFETGAKFTLNQQMQTGDSVTASGLVQGPTVSLGGQQHASLPSISLTQAAAIGNYVWLDTDKDGLVDPEELGVSGVTVHLLNENGLRLANTVTDSDGRYEFVVAPGRYWLQFVPENSIEFTLANGGNDERDSDVDPKSGRTGLLTVGPGVTDFSNFAGFIVSPTAIQLLTLSATETLSGVLIRWQTGEELATFGFELRRSRDGTLENAVTITEDVILAKGDGTVTDGTAADSAYLFLDRTARIGQSYSYWLVEIQTDEQRLPYGPARIVVGANVLGAAQEHRLFLPLIQR